MSGPSIYYCEPIIRPPSEANSLLIHATVGCMYRCSFCIPYMQKKFRVRGVDEVKKDIDAAVVRYRKYVRRVFLLDGNAMAMGAAELLEVTKYLNETFGHLQRVSVYAHVKDIVKKTDDELAALGRAGLKMAYIGIESGDDELLAKVSKHQTADDVVEAFGKCFKAGITPSGTVILGLAGDDRELSIRHMKKTAELVNRLSPVHFAGEGNLPVWYISCLALMVPGGTEMDKDIAEGRFRVASAEDILQEMKVFMENISDDVEKCIFRSNHASNYLALSGRLCRDRDKMLETINMNLECKRDVLPEEFRGL